MVPETNYLTQLIIAIPLALGGIALGVQSLSKAWKSSSTESHLLQMMHEELERMSNQNATLSQEVGKLQVELVRLSSQLTSLNSENQKLQAEVSGLNQEISRLHSLLIGK